MHLFLEQRKPKQNGKKVRIERLEKMRAAHVHVLNETPEEDAWKKMVAWARPKGLLKKGARVFGRNTYPIDNPHGYEFFLTVGWDIEPDGDIDIRQIPGGVYAVLRFIDLDEIGNAWEHLICASAKNAILRPHN